MFNTFSYINDIKIFILSLYQTGSQTTVSLHCRKTPDHLEETHKDAARTCSHVQAVRELGL